MPKNDSTMLPPTNVVGVTNDFLSGDKPTVQREPSFSRSSVKRHQQSSHPDDDPDEPRTTDVQITPCVVLNDQAPVPPAQDEGPAGTVRAFPQNEAIPEELLRMPLELSGLHQKRSRSRFPGIGEEIFGFRLWHALGAGAFGKVFLGEQIGLANRPVVLKITDRVGDEPQVLAQLQHANIVPIYSVHENNAGLRAVCMPYFGGATLQAVLAKLRFQNPFVSSDNEFLTCLDQVRSPTLDQAQSNQPGSTDPTGDERVPALPEKLSSLRTQIRPLSPTQTAIWMIARLADGLQHAHDRGILHGDIKPANVLIADDGQPMLLDFNLSRGSADPANSSFGGTIAYMAPEALQALRLRTPELVRLVDHRSDVYSLGMVMFETLTGSIPSAGQGSYSMLPAALETLARKRADGSPSLRSICPEMSWGLESVLLKCLDPNPDRRYQRAEHLSDDLRRLLSDQPLAHAPELSRIERLAKWKRRNPRVALFTVVGTCVVSLFVITTVLAGVMRHLSITKEELAVAQSMERKQKYQESAARALMLVNVNTEMQDPIRRGRQLCEETLSLYGVLDRSDWQEQPDWTRLDSDDRRRLGEDTRELLLSLAWARVRLASSNDPGTFREALDLLKKAEEIKGLSASPALWYDRAFYQEKLNDHFQSEDSRDQANRLTPTTARDHYLLATALLRTGEAANRPRAIVELDRSILANPRYYWAWFQRGVSHLRAGDQSALAGEQSKATGAYQLAAADFGVCIGLWPDFAWGHFNLACAHDRSGQSEEALRSYQSALTFDPEFVDARLNRGLIYLNHRRHELALTEFDAAIPLRPDDSSLLAGRAISLESIGRPNEADEAFRQAFDKAHHVPLATRQRIRLGHGFAVYQRRPAGALESFQAVIRDDARNADAFYGLAMVRAYEGKIDEAVSDLNRCLAIAPTRKDAWLHQAILLARSTRQQEAMKIVDRMMSRDPEDGEILYAGACVEALAARQLAANPSGNESAKRAITLLQAAIARGQSPERASKDPDLSGIQSHPEVREILRGVRPAKSP